MPLASPFGAPDPDARLAAEALAAELRRDAAIARELYAPGGGKMFGVLRARERDGRVTVLRAFSGMLLGTWEIEGFVGPAFDLPARDAFWKDGEAELGVLATTLAAAETAAAADRAALAALQARHADELAALRATHRARKAARRDARAAILEAAAIHALDQQSRADSAERARLEAQHAAERTTLEERVHAHDAARRALAEVRAARSRGLLHRIQDTYELANARGERRALRALFAPAEPPGGAGDCAAPKLLAEAYRRGATPLGIAEIWVGAPPATGDRRDGAFYPACRGKCGPILAHMLDGLDAAPHPEYVDRTLPADEPRTVYEDEWIAVVDKPVGLLSIPGRGAALRDSVLVRLRARYPDATGPLVVHRLDLDTSGLLLVAKDEATHTHLQAQFARREIDKRYVAWLDGVAGADGGTIELPLRVDVDDRPRQIHDPVHGKRALTEWRVLAREATRTRVELVPRTGRTHQLRVHAAHPAGIGVPIVGDRLYGRPAARLYLHAESLRFVHPHRGTAVTVERPAPF